MPVSEHGLRDLAGGFGGKGLGIRNRVEGLASTVWKLAARFTFAGLEKFGLTGLRLSGPCS